MGEVLSKYEYDGVEYDIESDRDANGVVVYTCVTDSNIYPVFIRTNGVNIFHYKVGDDEDAEWEACTSKYQLVQHFQYAADLRDDYESINTDRSWTNSAKALLHHMGWM